MQAILTRLFQIGPLLFGLLIFAPMFAAFADVFELAMPFGLTALQAGLITGGVYGLIATMRGRWL